MVRHFLFVAIVLLFRSTLALSPAFAASTSNNLRDVLQPERVHPLPERPAPVLPGAQPFENQPSGVGAATPFTLRAVIVEGATAVATNDLTPLYSDLLDRQVTVGDIEALVDAISRLYRQRGFFLSRAIAPPQSLDGGVLRIRVVEGYVATVAFAGRADASAEFEGYVAPIVGERPLRLDTLERVILLISDVGGVTVQPKLEPEDEDGGRYQLTLDIDRSPVDGLVSLDNYGTPGAGPLQSFASVGANGVLGVRERFQGWLSTVPNEPKELLAGGVEYQQPVGTDGLLLAVYASTSRVDRDRDEYGVRADASGLFFGTRAQYPLIRTAHENLWLNAAFDAYRLEQSEDGWMTSREQLRVLRSLVSYDIVDESGRHSFVSGEVSQGLPILGATHQNPSADPDLEGNTAFTKLKLNVAHDQPLGGDVSLRIEAAGQGALRRLPYAEEFGLGGSPFARGYDYYEAAGDDGIAGSLELQHASDRPFPGLLRLEPFAFFGIGRVWEENRGNDDARSLASTGVGVRAVFAADISAEFIVAERLPALGETRTAGGPRILFSLQKQFH